MRSGHRRRSGSTTPARGSTHSHAAGGPGRGSCTVAGVTFGLASLGTWNVADPSFSHATPNPVTNAMGYPGAVFSDIAMQFYGLASVAVLVPAVLWGILFAAARGVDRKPRRALAWFGASLIAAAIAGCITPPPTWPLPSGLGGVFGDMVLRIPALALGHYPTSLIATVLAVFLAFPALGLAAYGSGLLFRRNGFAVIEDEPVYEKPDARDLSFDDEDDESEGILALGAITHWWLSARAFFRRRATARHQNDDFYGRRSSSSLRRLAPCRRTRRPCRKDRSPRQRRWPRPRRAGNSLPPWLPMAAARLWCLLWMTRKTTTPTCRKMISLPNR